MSFCTETLYHGWAQVMNLDSVLFSTNAGGQKLEIFDNKVWGRVMVLDGVVQTTERDEYLYHEPMVQIPMFSHPDPRNVAIIGGGDGGAVREVSKHKGVETIDICELDMSIIEIAKEFFPNHSQGSYDDPRVKINIMDGLLWLKSLPDNHLDVIISDCTDPIGPGENLFVSEFYEQVHRVLRPGGIFAAQNGVVCLQLDEVTTTYQRLSAYFPHPTFYLGNVPTYVGGAMAFAFARKAGIRESVHGTKRDLNSRLVSDRSTIVRHDPSIDFRWYTMQIGQGAFNLPADLQRKLAEVATSELL